MTILCVRPHAQKVWPDVKFPGAASLASVLELQLLSESGRLRVGGGSTIAQVVHDERWVLGDRALIARLNPGEVVELEARGIPRVGIAAAGGPAYATTRFLPARLAV